MQAKSRGDLISWGAFGCCCLFFFLGLLSIFASVAAWDHQLWLAGVHIFGHYVCWFVFYLIDWRSSYVFILIFIYATHTTAHTTDNTLHTT